ncbi:sulfurtransferase [Aestuariivirga sp.]|uniref:sulfurtransferase n=1 Tax=Aestuariivirga sp. TaxID=2650926 RepID=UPI003782F951
MTIARVSHSRRRFVISAMAAAAVVATPLALRPAAAAQQASSQPNASAWVIPAADARKLITDGAVVLDVRGAELKKAAPLANAVAVEWPYFTKDSKAQKGQLLDDDAELTRRVQDLGVSSGKPVVVVADSLNGWGEDGRIVWTLRTLGHQAAYFVDGGIAALTRDGDPGIAPVSGKGDFEVKRIADFEITKEELRQKLGDKNVVILDTREPREYAGETPYGETRGGHVPGARHIFYKDFLDANGDVLPPGQVKAKLAELGIAPDAEVVSYCTGGIRSGFVTAVLANAGVKARNYAGSMWDWSSADAKKYPLVTGAN